MLVVPCGHVVCVLVLGVDCCAKAGAAVESMAARPSRVIPEMTLLDVMLVLRSLLMDSKGALSLVTRIRREHERSVSLLPLG